MLLKYSKSSLGVHTLMARERFRTCRSSLESPESEDWSVCLISLFFVLSSESSLGCVECRDLLTREHKQI